MLPLRGHALAGTPSECSQLPFLSDAKSRARMADGRAVCEVRQLVVTGLPDAPQLEPGEGWFYDDFSKGDACRCSEPICNSIIFTPNVPPSGVTVVLDCFETRAILPPPSPDLGLVDAPDQPAVLDACEPGDPDACARRLSRSRALQDDGLDRGLRCSPLLRAQFCICQAPVPGRLNAWVHSSSVFRAIVWSSEAIRLRFRRV